MSTELSTIKTIIEKHGHHVLRMKAIVDENPDLAPFVRKYASKVSHGVYDLSVIEGNLARKVIHEDEVPAMNQVITGLIPSIDQNYIPWGCYPVVRKVVQNRSFNPIYIRGESGNGKTMGVEQACAVANRELILISITNETTEEDLIGSFSLENGNVIWRDGPVLVAMRRGAVLCLDEIDQARPGAALSLQNVLQNKPVYIKKTNETVAPAHGFTVVATANTLGNGEGSDRYVGSQILNEAFIERFDIVLEQSYPTEAVERKILSQVIADTNLVEKLTRFAKVTRGAYQDGGVASCLTTRRLCQIARNMKLFSEVKAIEYALNRFNEDDRKSFQDLWTSLNPQSAQAAATDTDEE